MSLYKRGDVWWYKFQFNGQTICESTKSSSKTVAQDAQFARRRELEKSFNKIEKRALAPNFLKASTDWLGSRKKASPATLVKYNAAVAHLRKHFGGMLVSDIAAHDVTAYQNKRTAQKAAPATINTEVICLGSILKQFNLWHAVKSGVALLEEPASGGRALSTEEEIRLLQAASTTATKQGHWSPIYPVTVLALNTGLRHSEVRSLRWSQIDLDARVLVVGKSKTAAGTGRAVPLNAPAWAALDMWASRFPDREQNHYVFPACEVGRIDSSKPISNWRTAWRNACDAAKLNGLGFHSLRHSAATKLLENGVPFAVVAQILGWSASTSIRMAHRYGHIRPDVQRNALDKIATTEPSNLPAPSYKNGYSRGPSEKSDVRM